MRLLRDVDLRCKVVRASDPAELEEAVNDFLEEEVDADGEAQIEAITQSEGPAGITVTIWFSLLEEQGLDYAPSPEERLT